MRPFRSVGGRLALALTLVVAGVLAIVYLIVVPSYKTSLENNELNTLEKLLRARAVPNYPPEPWMKQQFASTLAPRVNARVLVFNLQNETPALLVPYADHLPTFSLGTASASVSHFLGRLATTLGHLDQADGHFTEAAAVHGRIGAPIWLARTRLEWARMLLLRGDAEDAERARQLLGQALATARELSLAHVERRTLALLR